MNYITTKDLEAELKVKQRQLTNRIKLLGIKPKLVGRVFVLTEKQAELVRNYPRALGRPRKVVEG